MSGPHYEARKLALTVAGRTYKPGDRIPSPVMENLKGGSLRHLLDTRRVVLVTDDEGEVAPALAAQQVNTRAVAARQAQGKGH